MVNSATRIRNSCPFEGLIIRNYDALYPTRIELKQFENCAFSWFTFVMTTDALASVHVLITSTLA